MYKVSKEVKQKLYEKFNTNVKAVKDDVNIIKAWMKTQPHLPEIMEDVKISNFLNLNKFSIEKTKQKIDMYYTIRGLIPEFFEESSLKLDNIRKVFQIMYLSTHPMLLNDCHRVYLFKLKHPNIFSATEMSKLWLAIFEVRLYEDFMIDDVIFLDMTNFTLNDIKKMTPTLIAKITAVYKKVYALRIHKIIYFNTPSYMSVLANILKAVLQPKIFERIQFHQDDAVLKEMLPIDMLPKNYGGEGPSLEELNEMMQKKFDEYHEMFDKLNNLKVNESLRPEKLDNDEILGFYGSFKKISVD